MSGKLLLKMVFSLLIAVVSTKASPAAAEENTYKNQGMSVSNQVAVNLWYKRDGSNCSLLKKHKIFTVEPGDRIEIFSDMTCETNYCNDTMTYENIRSYDSDRDCRVRILTGCLLSDM